MTPSQLSAMARRLIPICVAVVGLSLNGIAYGHDTPHSSGDLISVSGRFDNAYQKARQAIVRFAYGNEPRLKFGCGVIVSSDGYIAVSGPVQAIIDNDLLDLRLVDGRRVKGKALGWSSEFRFGLLKLTEEGPWPYV
jgi:S1-C subfamily serine protease